MDKSKFDSQQGLINQLIPDDLLPDQKIDDWKKQIVNAYSKQMGENPISTFETWILKVFLF